MARSAPSGKYTVKKMLFLKINTLFFSNGGEFFLFGYSRTSPPAFASFFLWKSTLPIGTRGEGGRDL